MPNTDTLIYPTPQWTSVKVESCQSDSEKMHCVLVSLSIWYFMDTISAYPNGAPCEAVDHIQPGSAHGDPQSTPSPYALRVFLGNERVRDGVITSFYHYTVEIYGYCNKWTPMKGYLVKAINATTGAVIGRFTKDDQAYWQATHYACRDSQFGAVTHFLSYDRDQPVGFKWVLEDGPKNVQYKDVKFEATVLQNIKTYWKEITWPESEEDWCKCPDQEEYKNSCLSYFRSGYCYETSVKDDFCPYTCNNCSGDVTLEDKSLVKVQLHEENIDKLNNTNQLDWNATSSTSSTDESTWSSSSSNITISPNSTSQFTTQPTFLINSTHISNTSISTNFTSQSPDQSSTNSTSFTSQSISISSQSNSTSNTSIGSTSIPSNFSIHSNNTQFNLTFINTND